VPTLAPAATLHTLEQQSAPFEQRSPVWMQNEEWSWQRPLEQSAEQHSESFVQELPAVVHEEPSAAHFPPVHCPLQHAPADEQAAPSTTHALAEHVPPTQARLQHSVDVLQLAPAGEHVARLDAHECVAASQRLEQQSAADVHWSPNRRQVS